MNLGFTILEIVGGLWTNSAAILSDALHDLGDSLSLGLAWFLGNYAERSQDERYSYGYRRYSLLGALVNTLILIGGSIFVLSEAIPRLLEPEWPYAPGMAVIAVAGIVVNGLAGLRVRRSPSLNVQTVAWHLLEEVLRVKSEVKALVDSMENFEHVTVEIEYGDEACRMNQEKVT